MSREDDMLTLCYAGCDRVPSERAAVPGIAPLERIPDAFRYVKKGQKTGNVVITVTRANEA